MNAMEIRLRVPRHNLSLFQFIIEGYDRVGTVTTLDAHEAAVLISIMPGFQDDLMAILKALKTELDLGFILD